MARGGREGAAQKDEEVELKSPGATMCSMAMGAYALECTSVRYLDDYFKSDHNRVSFETRGDLRGLCWKMFVLRTFSVGKRKS